MSVQSSTKDSYSCYHLLSQIYQDKIHTERLCHRLAEHSDSDQYNNKYSVSDKMIHEATNFIIISADRAAAVQENKDRQAERSTIRQ